MMEIHVSAKAPPEMLRAQEIVRKRLLKLRWIGRDEEAEKLGAEVSRLMPELIVIGDHDTD